MGKRTDYDLSGWGLNGRFLSVSEKEEIQELLFDEGVEDYGCSDSATEPKIMSFGDESFSAYDNVREALSGYAQRNPDVLLELEYSCDEDNYDHQLIRFKGAEVEAYGRTEIYPPFARLTLPGEQHSLPVLEFRFEAVDGAPETEILVLLDRNLSANTKEALEDSISSYIESMSALNFEQMIHDVLSAEGIGHWILRPTHTFRI